MSMIFAGQAELQMGFCDNLVAFGMC